MGIFDRFPYSSTHEMNLDFMLGKATEIAESLQEIDTHKEQAEQAATNATQSAQSAAQAAQAAAGSQTAAGTSASQAAQHKADAEDAADRAEAASNLADEAVEQAQTAAQNASTAAQNASTAADGAIASATAAETRINNLAASLPEDFTDLNNEVTDLKSALTLYEDGLVPIKPNTSDWYRGYISSSGEFVSTSTNAAPFNAPFLVSAGDVYTVAVNGLYAQVQTFSYSGGVYTRTSNNVYTSNKTLTFDSDTYLSIHVQKSNSSTLTLDEVTTKIYKKSKTQKQIDSLSDDINAVDNKATAVGNEFNSIASKQYSTYQIASYSEATKLAGYSFGTSGSTAVSGSANADYDSYYFYTDVQTALYFSSATPSSPLYIAITVGYNPSKTWETVDGQKQMTCSNPTRKRKSENNLPTSASPMDVSEAIVIFTVTVNTDVLFTINDAYKIKGSALPPTVTEKHPLLKYNSVSNGNVQVFIPNVDGYVRYTFIHNVDASVNANIWRVENAVHTDDILSPDYEITTPGEWEVAIKITGRDDFAGGIIHGDEVMTGITWVLDGKPVDITNFSDYTEFDTLLIAEQSELYDPNDSTTIFAEHNSLHIFNSNGLTIKQYVKFVEAESINAAYMAMLPIAQSVSDRIITNKDYVPATTENKLYSGVSDVIMYDTNKVITTRFYVPEFNFLDSTTFICNDNGGSSYHKCYFVNVIDTKSITSGTVWRSESRYEFVTGNED